jgi:dehydrogenase/reductase SDR family protein 12
MTRLHFTIETRLPIDEAFAFVADFANNAAWDPNTETSERIDAGPVGVGARYKLAVKMRGGVVPMEYRVTTWEPGSRVVLQGTGATVSAVDDLRFMPSGSGTRIDYTADIRLTGWMRLFEPLAGGAFEKIGRGAEAGMHEALEERAGAAVR